MSDSSGAADGRVRVFARLRPVAGCAQDSHAPVQAFEAANAIRVLAGTDPEAPFGAREFNFDGVFPGDAGQSKVFTAVGVPVLRDCLRGINGTIFAYGQTGSGKTHSLLQQGVNAEDAGLLPRLVAGLFVHMAQDVSAVYEVEASALQVYNEHVDDLLHSEHHAGAGQGLSVQNGGVVPGLTWIQCQQPEQMLDAFTRARSNIVSAETKMNKASSRSHAVFQLQLTKRPRVPPAGSGGSGQRVQFTQARLSVVDLAGSERVKKSGVEGVHLREATAINKSLLALGNVVSALALKRQHVPLRDSKLTRLLERSIGGNCKTVLLLCASPAAEHMQETVSSLEFASRAMHVEVKAKVNTCVVEVSSKALLEDFNGVSGESGSVPLRPELQPELQALRKDLADEIQRRSELATRLEMAIELIGEERQERLRSDQTMRKMIAQPEAPENEAVLEIKDELQRLQLASQSELKARSSDDDEAKQSLEHLRVLIEETEDRLSSAYCDQLKCISEAMELETKQRLTGDEEAVRVATNAKQLSEKETRDRKAFEDKLAQRLREILAAVDKERSDRELSGSATRTQLQTIQQGLQAEKKERGNEDAALRWGLTIMEGQIEKNAKDLTNSIQSEGQERRLMQDPVESRLNELRVDMDTEAKLLKDMVERVKLFADALETARREHEASIEKMECMQASEKKERIDDIAALQRELTDLKDSIHCEVTMMQCRMEQERTDTAALQCELTDLKDSIDSKVCSMQCMHCSEKTERGEDTAALQRGLKDLKCMHESAMIELQQLQTKVASDREARDSLDARRERLIEELRDLQWCNLNERKTRLRALQLELHPNKQPPDARLQHRALAQVLFLMLQREWEESQARSADMRTWEERFQDLTEESQEMLAGVQENARVSLQNQHAIEKEIKDRELAQETMSTRLQELTQSVEMNRKDLRAEWGDRTQVWSLGGS